jgi:hypothetical protein
MYEDTHGRRVDVRAAKLERGRRRNRDDEEDEEEDYYSSSILGHGRGHHKKDEEDAYSAERNNVAENALRERRDATSSTSEATALPLYVRGAETEEQIKTIDASSQASPVAKLTQQLAARFEASATASLEDCGCRECDEDEFVEEDAAIAEEFLRISPGSNGKVLVSTTPARRYRSRDGKVMVREYKVADATAPDLSASNVVMRGSIEGGEALSLHLPLRSTPAPMYSAQGNDSDRPNVVFRYGPDGKELTHIYVVTKFGANWFTRLFRSKKEPETMYVYPNPEEDVDVKQPLLDVLKNDKFGRALNPSVFETRFRREITREVALVERQGTLPHKIFSSSEALVKIRTPRTDGSLGQLQAYTIEEIDLDQARAENITKSQLLSWNQKKDRELYLGRRLELEVGDEVISLKPSINTGSIMDDQLQRNVWYSHSPIDRTQPAVVFHFASAPDGDPANDRLAHIYLVRRDPNVSDAYGAPAAKQAPARTAKPAVIAAIGRLAEKIKGALADDIAMAKLNDALVALARETTLKPAATKKRVDCGRVLTGFLASAAAPHSTDSWIDLARAGSLHHPVLAGSRITGSQSLASKKDIQQLAACLEQIGECMNGLSSQAANRALQAQFGPLLKAYPYRAAAIISSFAHACTSAVLGHRLASDHVSQLWMAKTPLETADALKLF